MNDKVKMGIQPIGNQLKNNIVQSKNTRISHRPLKLNNKIPMINKNLQSRSLHTTSTTTSTKHIPYVNAIAATNTATDKKHDSIDPNENNNAETHYTNTQFKSISDPKQSIFQKNLLASLPSRQTKKIRPKNKLSYLFLSTTY